jgi:hypothetical protein
MMPQEQEPTLLHFAMTHRMDFFLVALVLCFANE